MELSINDFPLREENNIIYNKNNKIIIDLEKASKDEITAFSKLILYPANYGKKFFIKRITRTYPTSLKECKEIAEWEFLNKGWKYCKKGEHELELTVISSENYFDRRKEILYFNKK